MTTSHLKSSSTSYAIAALIAVAALACSQGEKTDFNGPPDPKPIDNTIAAIVVTPSIVTAQPSEGVGFAAYGRNTHGDSIAAAVNWSTSGGTISANGVFSAVAGGRYWVTARSTKQADKADSASVYIAAPSNPITSLTVVPKTVSMKIGQSRQFTATAGFQDKTTAQIPVFWSVSSGSITSDGLYTPPPQPGLYLVIGIVASGISDTAKVTVASAPILTSLALSPTVDSLEPGDVKQYAVQATWSDGQDSVASVDFAATGGMITPNGAFTATAVPGTYLVTATQKGGTVTTAATVRVRESIVGVDLTPSSVTLAPGASYRFTALGKRRTGGSATVSINWQATGGTISAEGVFAAGSTPGTYRVIATLSGRVEADTSTVVIANAASTLTQLVLNPSAVTLGAGEVRQFTVAGSWSDGSSTTPAVIWTATGGTITTTGTYTAGSAPGHYAVIARHQAGTKADTSTVTVTPPALVSMTLTPTLASVKTGATQQFSVTGHWSDGSGGTPTVSWQTTGGTISSTGLFTAGSSTGTFPIIALAANGIADTSLATVSSPAAVLQQVVINPHTVILQTGQAQQFYVTGVWSNGANDIPAVVWSTSAGSITSGGKYTAPAAAGSYSVIARHQSGTLADTVTVTVTPIAPTLKGIKLTPATVTLQPGGLQQYSVQGNWSDGSTSGVPVLYSATGGTIAVDGSYQAGTTAGGYHVIAVQQGGTFADTSAVTISSGAPQLVGLSVTPDSVTVGVGGTQTYTVAGVWTNGGSGAPAVVWTTDGGTISPSGVYTAPGEARTYRVVATQQSGTLADTVVVFVTAAPPSLTQLTVKPKGATSQTATTTQFTVAAQWSNGTTALPPVAWSASGGTITTSGLYSAGSTPGTYRVVAQEVGGAAKADTASLTLSGAYVTSLAMTPATVSVNAGQTQQLQVAATWSDGVSRPAAVTFAATGGTVTVGGLFTAGSVGGNFMVIATCACGQADTSIISINPGSATLPTLVSISLSPKSSAVSPGATQQFGLTAQWSDGSTTVPQVTWSAPNASITAAGLYSAPTVPATYQVIATDAAGSISDTALVTVIGGPPQNPGHPNEPAGLSRVAEVAFAPTLPPKGVWETTSAFGVLAGKWNQFGSVHGNVLPSSDPTAPASPADVFRFKFPTGEASGASISSLDVWDSHSGEYSEYYETAWYRIPSADFELARGGTKLWGYWRVADSQGPGIYNDMEVGPVASIVNQIPVRFFFSHGSTDKSLPIRAFYPNSNQGKKIQAGVWQQYEIHMKLNTLGVANGILQVWLDGVKIMDYSDVVWITPGYQRGFYLRHWDPVWGGGAGTPKTRDDFLDIDHIYISGR